MGAPPIDPHVADELTGYDEERLVTYLRLRDAAAEDADWREVAKIVLPTTRRKNPIAHYDHGRPFLAALAG